MKSEFFIGTYGYWIRKDSWKINFINDNSSKIIICAKMEEYWNCCNGGMDPKTQNLRKSQSGSILTIGYIVHRTHWHSALKHIHCKYPHCHQNSLQYAQWIPARPKQLSLPNWQKSDCIEDDVQRNSYMNTWHIVRKNTQFVIHIACTRIGSKVAKLTYTSFYSSPIHCSSK